jgi:serine/threonine protein kinase
LSLALEESELGARETLDGTALGQVLADRYQMRELLGRGGMGEVWRAFDLKLRVDVALKALRPERLSSAKARELLRQEVRSAREVVSPNVCRIFDLVVETDQELVSMEFIDGVTLAETLRDRGPLALEEAREVASQFLSGLEAIHQAGLVHRDFKPENVMVTRAGRVVVMDFGLAKGHDRERTGTISGTPAYMAPEQARGDAVDSRADVFAAGVVLSEMLSVGNARARQELWENVRQTPPRVPDGAWSPVLKKALTIEPDSRYESARALSRALEEVTLRLPGFEDKHPYPGLAYFTEEDREFFFGREVDVEAVWKKLKRPRLLALIGPSGWALSVRALSLSAAPGGSASPLATGSCDSAWVKTRRRRHRSLPMARYFRSWPLIRRSAFWPPVAGTASCASDRSLVTNRIFSLATRASSVRLRSHRMDGGSRRPARTEPFASGPFPTSGRLRPTSEATRSTFRCSGAGRTCAWSETRARPRVGASMSTRSPAGRNFPSLSNEDGQPVAAPGNVRLPQRTLGILVEPLRTMIGVELPF